MMNLFLALLFMQSRADYLDFIYLTEPVVDWRMHDGSPAPDLHAICAEMKYNYIEEKTNLDRLQKELKAAVALPLDDAGVAKIEDIKKGIVQCTERLMFLAKPEWNSEVLDFNFVWNLWELGENPNKRLLKGTMKVLNDRYKGEFSPRVVNELSVGYQKDFYMDEPWDYFKYRTTGTFLEACQFLPTLEFELKIQIEHPPLQLVHDQLFFLKGAKP